MYLEDLIHLSEVRIQWPTLVQTGCIIPRTFIEQLSDY